MIFSSILFFSVCMAMTIALVLTLIWDAKQ